MRLFITNDEAKVLLQRSQLALGSLSLVEKQLLDIRTVLTTIVQKSTMNPIRGEENHQEVFDDPSDATPLEVYENEIPTATE